MTARAGAPGGARRQPDELADDPCGAGMAGQFSETSSSVVVSAMVAG
jgi:hypothetical protein